MRAWPAPGHPICCLEGGVTWQEELTSVGEVHKHHLAKLQKQIDDAHTQLKVRARLGGDESRSSLCTRVGCKVAE